MGFQSRVGIVEKHEIPTQGTAILLKFLLLLQDFHEWPEDLDPHIHPGCNHMGQKDKIPKPSSTFHLLTWHMEFGRYRKPEQACEKSIRRKHTGIDRRGWMCGAWHVEPLMQTSD